MSFAYYDRLTRRRQRVYGQSDGGGELHGLYSGASAGRAARVSVRIRTARGCQVVRFRTFLRTLLHELCRHPDSDLLALPDSFRTEGFYTRESSLLRPLVPSAEGAEAP